MSDYLITDYKKLGNSRLLRSLGIRTKSKKIKKKARVDKSFEKLIPKVKPETYTGFLKTAYWKKVSRAVKARDNNECRLCKSKRKLNAHHKRYPERFTEHLNLNLLECLCLDCHWLEHGILPKKLHNELEELNSKFKQSL